MTAISPRQSEKIKYHLEHIMEQLPDMKLTLLARNPLAPPGYQDVIITADDLEKVIESLEFQHNIHIQAQLDKFRQPS